jgi:diguanylate cyclase (GGDEF)-like protein
VTKGVLHHQLADRSVQIEWFTRTDGGQSRTITPVNLSTAAAQVMASALDGKVEDALALAERGLVEGTGASPSEQAALWYSIASVELIRGSVPGVLTAAERCVSLAVESDNSGWASCGLSIRAVALARQGRMEPALLDLARAESELDACEPVGLRCWAHMGLGYSYLELRLYELAQPHLENAVDLEASPIPLTEAPAIALRNLAELHIRWADELERVDGAPDLDEDREAVDRHRESAHGYAQRALVRIRHLDRPILEANCRAMELTSRPGSTGEGLLGELREVFEANPVDFQGARSVTGTALARALWAAGDTDEALAVARRAVEYAEAVGDWQVSASAQRLLVEIESQMGLPGAANGRSYAGLLSQVLWQQRLSTLQGAHAALQLERVHRDKEIAQRAASEDSLTGVGNRRALDDSLRALQAEDAALGSPTQSEIGSPLSLLMIDLDDFKQINDTYGHVVGDDVLRAVAMAIRGVARSDDVVARVGGDEFVILARGADREAGEHLAERITAAVDALAVGTRSGAITLHASVGVATAPTGTEAALLLARADEAMYAVKGPPRQRSGSMDDGFPMPRQPRG